MRQLFFIIEELIDEDPMNEIVPRWERLVLFICKSISSSDNEKNVGLVEVGRGAESVRYTAKGYTQQHAQNKTIFDWESDAELDRAAGALWIAL